MIIKNIQLKKRTPNGDKKTMDKISSTSINEDIIVKSLDFFTLKTYINISMLKAGIHYPKKHKHKEIRKKTYLRDFLKRLMKKLVTSP